jgi:hypothetical protein
MGDIIGRGGDVERWGEIVESISAEEMPLVFHFRPQRYIRVSEHRVGEWAEVFQKELGIRPSLEDDDDGPYGPQPTISGSGDGWDDCD